MEVILNVNNETFVKCKLDGGDHMDTPSSLSSTSSSSPPPPASNSSSPVNRGLSEINGTVIVHQNSLENEFNEKVSATSLNTQSINETMTEKAIVRNNKSAENSTNAEVFCICKRSADEYSEEDMMIECDACNDWLHGR
jgi:hypothetical protein